MDEGAEAWADYYDAAMPWCCWNVLYAVIAIERRLAWDVPGPQLLDCVYQTRRGRQMPFVDWLLASGRKRMAIRACAALGCDAEVAKFVDRAYLMAVAARQRCS